MSTPLSPPALATLQPAHAVQLLTYFRADSIVADCEAIRKALDVKAFSLLGQSFGGFCSCTYLSFHARSLKEVLITGGLAPLPALCCPAAVDAVYAALYPRVATQTQKYYSRFPGDVAAVQRIVLHLANAPGGAVDLPSGGRLTPRGLQLLGWGLGSCGGFEALHYLLERAWDTDLGMLVSGQFSASVPAPKLSLAFLRGYEAMLPFDTNPLYALIHEACYANGGATRWAAQRALDSNPSRAAAFDPVAAAREGRPVPLTGEMVYPFMFDDIASLRPLKAVANALAEHDWPASLYSVDALGRNTVPAAATAYFEDMYVDANLALQTASRAFLRYGYCGCCLHAPNACAIHSASHSDPRPASVGNQHVHAQRGSRGRASRVQHAACDGARRRAAALNNSRVACRGSSKGQGRADTNTMQLETDGKQHDDEKRKYDKCQAALGAQFCFT